MHTTITLLKTKDKEKFFKADNKKKDYIQGKLVLNN